MKLSRRTFLKLSGSAVAASVIATKVPWVTSRMQGILSPGTLSEAAPQIERIVPTTCWIGKQDCGMLVRLVDGRAVKLEGHPDHPRNRGTLCPKGQAQIMAFYDPYRLKAPLKRVNEKGVHGRWQEISWDEALSLVAEKVREVREKDPRLLIWQKGRSKAKAFYDKAFVKASGATKLSHGAYCSDAGYRAAEYTVGLHGVIHPDFRHCRYLLSWGWNLTNAGGNKLCWITWPQQFLDARERGMKVVAIDPWRRGVGPHSDEWLPVRPGTDMALFLAMANVLISKGYVDREYLKKYTNAPFLLKEDGYFLRSDGKELVWDQVTGSAVPYDAPGVDPALEGEFDVDGVPVKPVFQAFIEHAGGYTPQWASEICDVPASTIERIATELGEAASIGSTTVMDGVELPYRPVGMMAYHVVQQELGFQSCRAALILFMLLGAIEAVGGIRVDFHRGVHKNFFKLEEIEVKDPPYDITLKDSKWFPINTGNPSIAAQAIVEPEKHEVEFVPEVMIIHMANPLLSFPPQADIIDAYRRFRFIAVIDPWMSETADYFADVILPAATIEKYEGPLNVTDQYTKATSLRVPPMQPLFQSRGEIDIYIDLCEKIGILYGEGGYIDHLNKELKLEDPYKLPLDRKPAVRDIFDRWAKSQGIQEGVAYFETQGVKVEPIPANELYAPAWDPPYGGIRHRLYGEGLKRYQDDMKARGVDRLYWRLYTPFPTWEELTMTQSPPEYDLTLISHKKIEFKQSRSTFIPLLNELEPEQRLEINPRTARERGIADGEEVWVESHNAVTGETRRIRAKVLYMETIRPDTVALSHHYGAWAHPWSRGGGETPNVLFFTGPGYVANTADQSFQVRVRVYR